MWSWSHTDEAYDNARENFYNLDIEELKVIAAEWDAYNPDHPDADPEGFVFALYDIPDTVDLADLWNKIQEFATCDNGGGQAWMCPYGCHTVSFDKE